MTYEVSEGKAAARELAARLPGWSVWYGQHTGRFWAMPRSVAQGGGRLVEGETPEQLEDAVRRLAGGPRQGEQPQDAPRADQTQMDAQYRREPVGTRN
ncbi:hypothetical protein [Sphaerisporangium corydalis]|uniref:DUF2188 domain-containing protein n=1 Tax=Sphaerisporangium corydalis TaxID=1441875 RepID=A0ABV9ERK0_9ACTN|nr:hypothetical protein [Sphaerisporangium corydalis]